MECESLVCVCRRDLYVESKEMDFLSLENSDVLCYGTLTRRCVREAEEDKEIQDHIWLHQVFCVPLVPRILQLLLTTVIQEHRPSYR
jgi:hypothetical protein